MARAWLFSNLNQWKKKLTEKANDGLIGIPGLGMFFSEQILLGVMEKKNRWE